jgi:hypothetical protein
VAVCSLLLAHKSDPNASAADGESPLFFASRRSRAEVVGLLLLNGANADMVNRYGDRAADDATDDDTLHQFLLHSQRKASGGSTTSALRDSNINSRPGSGSALSSGGALTRSLKKEVSLGSVIGEKVASSISGGGGLMRSSNLKRCLRYLRKQELICAALTCTHWRDAAADSRLWLVFFLHMKI